MKSLPGVSVSPRHTKFNMKINANHKIAIKRQISYLVWGASTGDISKLYTRFVKLDSRGNTRSLYFFSYKSGLSYFRRNKSVRTMDSAAVEAQKVQVFLKELDDYVRMPDAYGLRKEMLFWNNNTETIKKENWHNTRNTVAAP